MKNSADFNKTYNNWGYGLQGPDSYVSEYRSQDIIANYRQQKVFYLLGDRDTGTSNLENSCPAAAQGRNRVERGAAYVNHIQMFYNSPTHVRVNVPGVGHSGAGMFQASQGRAVLFPR